MTKDNDELQKVYNQYKGLRADGYRVSTMIKVQARNLGFEPRVLEMILYRMEQKEKGNV
jgi:hypothetical protein